MATTTLPRPPTQARRVDTRYVIQRLRSDLRNEIYELMTHTGYHALEKELTEQVLNSSPLYAQLRRHATSLSTLMQERDTKKELFAYAIFRRMNEVLGGFHFDRYRSLSSGPRETQLLVEVVDAFDFDSFLENYANYEYLKEEPDYEVFVQSKQYRLLEDSITSAIKKNRVIPAVQTAIGKDIADALHLTEDYGYIRPTEDLLEKEFDLPPRQNKPYVSLTRVTVAVNNQTCPVLLKRMSRNSQKFRLLVTNFGALIRGNE